MKKSEIISQLEKRILVLDGAMGTLIQKLKLEEKDYRGERYKDHPDNLKGNYDVLSITRPEIIRDIQKAPDKVRECVRVAARIIAGIKDMGMAGVLISTVGWEDKLPFVLDEARL